MRPGSLGECVGNKAHITPSEHAAAVADGAASNVQSVRGHTGAAVQQLATCSDDQIASTLQSASLIYAKTALCADKTDLVGIHATNRRYVQAESASRCVVGGGNRVCDGTGVWVGGEAGVIQLIGASDDIEFIGIDSGIDLHGSGENVGVACAIGVQSTAFNTDAAATDVPSGESPCTVELRCSRGQNAAIGIDETATIAGDAVRVGDDQVGSRPGNFHKATQCTDFAAQHLVDNDSSAAAIESGIAVYPASQFGIAGVKAIVEDHSFGTDTERLPLVHGYAA